MKKWQQEQYDSIGREKFKFFHACSSVDFGHAQSFESLKYQQVIFHQKQKSK